jgi:hypothetical protein
MNSPLYRIAFAALLINILSVAGIAQGRFEVGLNLGPSNFLGDLGGTSGKGATFLKDNNLSMTRIMKGAVVSYNSQGVIGVRLAFNVGRLEGADSIIKGNGGLEEARRARNQHFRSPLVEGYAALEIYPTALFDGNREDVMHKIRPYGILGVGVFRFNPQAQYIDPSGNAQWVDLQPLRTEGQGMGKYQDRELYNLTQINIPYGVGVKYYVSDRVSFAFEIVNRKTFTDYIDDVSTTYIAQQDFYDFFGANSPQAEIAAQMSNKSQLLTGGLNRAGYEAGDKRGTPTNNDAFYASTLKLGIRLGSSAYGSMLRRATHCPLLRF